MPPVAWRQVQWPRPVPLLKLLFPMRAPNNRRTTLLLTLGQ
jgi:hypothetical protein